MPDFSLEQHDGQVKATSATTNGVSHSALFPILQFKDMVGAAAQDDSKAEWRLDHLIVTMSAAGTFKLTDGSADLTPAFSLAVGVPLTLDGPIFSGRGKAMSYTTVITGNTTVVAFAAPMHHSSRKATNFA